MLSQLSQLSTSALTRPQPGQSFKSHFMGLAPYLCAASASVPTGTSQKQPWVFFTKSFYPTLCIFRDCASRNVQPRASVRSLRLDLVPAHWRKPLGCDHSSPSFLEVLQELSRCPSFYRAPNNIYQPRRLCCGVEMVSVLACPCPMLYSTMRLQISVETAVDFAFSPLRMRIPGTWAKG